MVRNIQQSDFHGDELVLLAGQSAIVVIDKDKQRRGEADPVVCSMIGDEDEVAFLYRLHKMDPGDLDIRYMTTETDPTVMAGVFDEMDFRTEVMKRLEDVPEFGVNFEDPESVTMEQELRYMYDGMSLDGVENKELSILNHNPTEYREGYIAPADVFALYYGAGSPVGPYDEFLKTYEAERMPVTFSCDMPIEGGQMTRVVVSLYPEVPEGYGPMVYSFPGAKTRDEARGFLDRFVAMHDF